MEELSIEVLVTRGTLSVTVQRPKTGPVCLMNTFSPINNTGPSAAAIRAAVAAMVEKALE